ncbi:Subtilisin inhibitor-like [Thermomonospora echinospora]|uniref:Subtilisin inhibitor-like n=1 Tax=Thermomonospora echinospora TaxID=1992 RepID=A0A1H6E781_9ACTN|nr:SSI family serine proteinase inhibitor [Thermomonospora echinospora]SEG93113.1 Subtilisin inhibitor-like [Thermomonospora echinospora]
MPHLAATTLTGAALVALLPAGIVLADTPSRYDRPAAGTHGTHLKLTVTYPGAPVSSARTVTLRCDPAGRDHPHAAAACADLDRSHGRFLHDPRQTICTMEYRPVTAKATGRWQGRAVSFTKSFPNACVMDARTGAVFRF